MSKLSAKSPAKSRQCKRTFRHNFLLKNVKKKQKITLKPPMHILASNSIFYNFFRIFRHSEIHNLNLKLGSEQYNKIDLLHLVILSQLSGV